jgi:signal transduction histidine kinase/ligand-binding sensor domain-containing protein
VRDGLLPAAPSAIAQTTDGYLWIGSAAGLMRFDGVKFEAWKAADGVSRLPDDRIVALLAGRDGSLWVGTAGGLAQLKGGNVIVHARVGRFGALAEDGSGVVWAGHTRALRELPPLCRLDRDGFRCFGRPLVPFDYVGALATDRKGNLWVSGDRGVCRWSPRSQNCYPIPALADVADKYGVFELKSDREGRLWAGAASVGLWVLEANAWKRADAIPVPPERIESLYADRSGGVWIGTNGRGLLRRVGDRLDTFSHEDGLSSNAVFDVFEDREHDIWLATSAGLDRLRDLKVTTMSAREGLADGNYLAVVAARGGGVWIAIDRALARVNGATRTFYRPNEELPGNGPTSLFEDSRGRLWLGIDNRLARLEHGRFMAITLPDGTDTGVVREIVEDRNGDVWVATAPVARSAPSLLQVHEDRIVRVFSGEELGGNLAAVAADPRGGLWVANARGQIGRIDGRFVPSHQAAEVRNLFVDARGVWAATRAGVLRIANGSVSSMTVRNGLPCDDVESAIKAKDGSLWLKSVCGIVSIAPDELAAWCEQPDRRVRVRTLDAMDGAQAGLPPFTPRAAQSSDGRLWFTIETGGVQVVDPAVIHRRTDPPPMRITRVVADRKDYGARPRFTLPALTKDVEIDYTALSFAMPEKVRFRYRLDGVDADWKDVSTRREAYYTNLKPGHYRFHVIASHGDGIWHREGATIELSILPAFYQMRLFFMLCVVAMAALGWLAYAWRVHHVRTNLIRRFSERLEERARIARDLHDTLLQGFLSSSMQLHVAIKSIPVESPSRAPIERVYQLMRQVIDQGRASLRNLRASHDTDHLEQALARVPSELGIQDGITFRVVVEGRPRPLRGIVRDELYRIAREALVNAYRHAAPRNIEIGVEYGSDALRVVVRDDGRGIASDILQSGRNGHWGLAGMRERADSIGAQFAVRSREGHGTEVEIVVANAIGLE